MQIEKEKMYNYIFFSKEACCTANLAFCDELELILEPKAKLLAAKEIASLTPEELFILSFYDDLSSDSSNLKLPETNNYILNYN